ncbi:outer membrane receptor for ferric coprogen and ferric-rhodotorulic acid [Pseudomonas sp. TE3786]
MTTGTVFAMPMKSPRYALALAVHLALGSTLLAGLAQSASAATTSQHYAIAAGPLGTALNRFAQQAGVAIVFDAQRVAGLSSPGLNGDYGVNEGFAALLRNTGYVARQSSNGFVLEPAPAAGAALELQPTSITGESLGAITEGSGSYTTGSTTTATKLPLSIRETPQSVSVITEQRMRDQNMVSLENVIAQAPGVEFKKKGNSSDDEVGIFSRGLKIENFQVDGIPTVFEPEMKSQDNDMAVYDHVEIVRGSTGLLSGTGNPSATINMVRKRPTRDFQASIQGSAGSWDNYRTEMDVSGPLTETGNVRGRLVGAYQTADSFTDRLSTERQVAYGIIEADLSERDTVSFGVDYQVKKCDACGYFGFPAFFSNGNRTDFERSYNSAADWSYADRQRTSVFTTYEHRFDNDWLAKVAYTNTRDKNDVEYGWFSSVNYPNQQTGAGASLFFAKWPSRPEQNAIDAYATGPFSLFGREHELMVGVSANKYTANVGAYPLWNDWSGSGWNPAIPNVYKWHGDIARPPMAQEGDIKYQQRNTAAYSAVRLKPVDDLAVILGTRLSYFKLDKSVQYDWDPGVEYAPEGGHRKETGEVTPYAGVVYDLDEHYSVYASYTKIFKPQTAQTLEGKFADPAEGDSYEIGSKAAYYEGRLNLTAALFETKLDNYPAGTDINDNLGNEYVNPTNIKIKGAELEVAGEILPGWQMQAGYSHINTYYPQNMDVNVGFPKNSVKLFSTYNFQGDLNRLTLGGGLRWESATSYDNSQVIPGRTLTAKQESYALVDLLARYKFDEHFTGTLNVDNIFDKEYYASTSVYSDLYGEPRSVTATLRWEY